MLYEYSSNIAKLPNCTVKSQQPVSNKKKDITPIAAKNVNMPRLLTEFKTFILPPLLKLH